MIEIYIESAMNKAFLAILTLLIENFKIWKCKIADDFCRCGYSATRGAPSG
jgi:hypothetical protein